MNVFEDEILGARPRLRGDGLSYATLGEREQQDQGSRSNHDAFSLQTADVLGYSSQNPIPEIAHE
jgi:hypothetical protein